MAQIPPNQRLNRLVEELRQDPGLAEQMSDPDASIIREALQGLTVYEIGQNHHLTEAAVWEVLSNAARMAAGNPVARRVETAGMGSDTDPGVTGGYGDTGFGSIGNEPPVPNPEEPVE